MIYINYSNILRNNIGLNGITEKRFHSLCSKYQPLTKEVFRAKSKFGYDFLNLPDDVKLVRKIKKYVDEQKKNKWENIVVLGIGGSALGAMAARDALTNEFERKPKLYVLDNIDPDYVHELLDNINFSKTLFIVISKSGTTTEPMALYGIIKEKLSKVKNYQKNLLFITDPKKGLLRTIAKKEGINTFDIPPKVGGRYSALSSVGLVPLALIGIDINGLLRGAKEMREHIKKAKDCKNPALALALVQFLMDKKKDRYMTVFMPYSNKLSKVGDWYSQLLAESIGKNKKSGPTPINALGTTDQHSQLQLYMEGPNNKLIVFLRVLKYASDFKLGEVLPKELEYLNGKKMSKVIDSAYLGTSGALTANSRPNITIEVPKVDAKNLGALFILMQFQVALLGLMYKVDAFNQPGVEDSKKITKELLSK